MNSKCPHTDQWRACQVWRWERRLSSDSRRDKQYSLRSQYQHRVALTTKCPRDSGEWEGDFP